MNQQSGQTLAIMFTMTAFGTWLRGDKRGWVQDGKTYPANPTLEAKDRAKLKHPPFLFDAADLFGIGNAIGESLMERLEQRILAMAIRTWDVHFIVSKTNIDVSRIAKCAKDAVRYHLRPGRPIWTTGYDKRFCFDEQTVHNRVRYIEQHNTEQNQPARPWAFIKGWRE